MVPMQFGRSTAINLQRLVHAVCLQYGITLERIATAVSDGASNVIKVSVPAHSCAAHMCAQWQRLLCTYGEWCYVHRAHLCAVDGLSALTVVGELDAVCVQLQQVQFVRTMHILRNNNMIAYGHIKLIRIQKVDLLQLFYSQPHTA